MGNRHHGSQGASPARGTPALRALEIHSQHSQKRLKPLGSFHRKEQTHLSHHSFRTRFLEPAHIPRKAGKPTAHTSFSKGSSHGGVVFIPTPESWEANAEVRRHRFALKQCCKAPSRSGCICLVLGDGREIPPRNTTRITDGSGAWLDFEHTRCSLTLSLYAVLGMQGGWE